MARIESRRSRRRIMRTALPGLAVLLVCAAIALAVLLPKLKGRRAGEDRAEATPAPTSEPVTQAPSTEAVLPTDAPASVIPTEGAAAPTETAASDAATPVPEQSTEDRSLILVTAGFGSSFSSVKGSCSVSFVNNTPGVMYAAYFEIGPLAASNASVGGAAVRYSVDLPGVLTIPFANELKPGEALDIYFEFEGRPDPSFTVPHPAYDTAYDAVCYLSSFGELNFSAGETSLEMNGGTYVYKLTAERASGAILVSAD